MASKLALAAVPLFLVLTRTSVAAPPLPALPGGDAPAGPAAPAGAADGDQLRRGVVQIEQGGRPIAVGTVLQRDGRILTSLSALGAATDADIRYADNTVVKAKVGHKDRDWDLVLLIPQSGKWMDGLQPTTTDPSSVALKAFLPKGGKLSGVVVSLRGRTDARTRDGDPLPAVLDFDLKGVPSVLGAPVLDPNGKVVALLVHACKDSPDAAKAKEAGKPAVCAPVTVGAPVAALRGFLMKTPASAVQPAAWLGLGGAPTEAGNVKGIRVMGVAPGSPAEKAGLKTGDAGDTIVAVDGQPVETPEALSDVIGKRGIGQTVKLLVYSGGKFRDVAATLRAAPPPAP